MTTIAMREDIILKAFRSRRACDVILITGGWAQMMTSTCLQNISIAP